MTSSTTTWIVGLVGLVILLNGLSTRAAMTTATKVYVTIGGLMLLGALYFFFEKGPNKGLVRSRRRSR